MTPSVKRLLHRSPSLQIAIAFAITLVVMLTVGTGIAAVWPLLYAAITAR